MKKAKFKFGGWLMKAIFLASLLIFYHGQVYANASIVNSTKKIATDNINKVKSSATELVEELKAIKDDFSKASENASDIWKDGGDAASESLSKLNETFEKIKKMDVDGLKKMDLESLKKTVDELKSSVQGESDAAKSIRTHLGNLESKTA